MEPSQSTIGLDVSCPICLEQILQSDNQKKCPQCIGVYHEQCIPKAQCALCRMVYDNNLWQQEQRSLTEHYDTVHEDEYEQFADDDTSDEQDDVEYDDDPNYIPPRPYGLDYLDQSSDLLFTNRMLTRSMRATLLERMGNITRDLHQIWNGVNY